MTSFNNPLVFRALGLAFRLPVVCIARKAVAAIDPEVPLANTTTHEGGRRPRHQPGAPLQNALRLTRWRLAAHLGDGASNSPAAFS